MPAAPPRPRPAGAVRTSSALPRRPSGYRRAPLGGPYRKRLVLGRILLVVALGLATVKLVVIQTVQAGDLRAASADQATTPINLPAARGAILDRDGNTLAFSIDSRQLVTSPRTIARTHGADTPRYIAAMTTVVAAATGADPADIAERLNRDTGYVKLGDPVEPAVADRVREQFVEIAEERRELRQYPAGTTGASVIGAASWSIDDKKVTGKEGLEVAEDNVLAGSDGLRVVDTAEGSNAVIPGSTRFERAAVQGSDLQLTLDSDAQYTVQRLLEEKVAESGAKPNSSAVVLDAKTGQILAMANGQAYDPARFTTATNEQRSNPAVQSPFEPGSVNKVVTMAAALEFGVAKPDDVLTVPGSIKVADRTVNDAWNHGTEHYTLTGVLAKSSNVGTLMTAQAVGEERWLDMLTRFGVGAKTGVELPSESRGQVPARETWSGSTFGNLPIGQGLTMTTLQMAGIYQAVANDGVRVPPRIVQATIGPDGVRTPSPAPEPVRVVSPETARQLRTMLTAVTQDAQGQRGTGYQAAVPGYQVAGKTGTAQQVDPDCKCYTSASHNITFAGMLPAEQPRYVVAIMLDAPAAGTSAAPLFHDIASYLAQRDRLPVSTEEPPVQTLVAP
ncbi:peptidoglycan D,D-transpeptidase FtsI family protein [Pseudonocardia lacus]|uniref:peptidoglycan D,D-transpeptidase FtsI family protein n=1 Tax=Pseudonocardia lacus TaxID=2835865 RepID=UPI001BDC45AC|nr:penicillin-binding protein 2 [Pseudonocardia lacus]